MHLFSNHVHLTYCTNIHPARGFAEVWASLKQHALPLKASLSPTEPFGIGLRLSGEESKEILGGDTLARFKAWLDEHGLYVFTMNGFPHGPFHAQPVKAEVHAPDWRTDERVAYTLRLAEALAELLPDTAPSEHLAAEVVKLRWGDARPDGGFHGGERFSDDGPYALEPLQSVSESIDIGNCNGEF